MGAIARSVARRSRYPTRTVGTSADHGLPPWLDPFEVGPTRAALALLRNAEKPREPSQEEVEAVRAGRARRGLPPLTREQEQAYFGQGRTRTEREKTTRESVAKLWEQGTLHEAANRFRAVRRALRRVERDRRLRSSRAQRLLPRGRLPRRGSQRSQSAGNGADSRGPPGGSGDSPPPSGRAAAPPSDDHDDGRSASWPRILLTEDLARIFRVDVATARQRLARGEFGPYFRSGKRKAVLRDSLLAHLAAQSTYPNAPSRRRRKST